MPSEQNEDILKLKLFPRHALDRGKQFPFPNGEILEEVRARTLEALENLVAKHLNETIALVAHRAPNKVICCALLGLDNSHFWRIQQDTASTNLFVYKDGQWIISYLNDTAYLKVLGKPALSDF